MDIKKIISEMTLEEKAGFCSGKDFWRTEDFERLGIPSVMVTDGPCGLRKQEGKTDNIGLHGSVKAISYPTGACVGSSFDRDLLKKMGETLGDECLSEDIGVLLGPAMNIKRSPLCGRNFEYYSEDPYISGELAAAYINGLQSKNVGSSPKHYAANSQEHRRMTSDSIVDERTLREIYLTGFELMVKKSKPWTVMCAYNQVNGAFASDHKYLLTDILRDEWGFDGYVVSDWGATNNRVKGIKAGMDLEMPGDSKDNTNKIIAAVQNGELDEALLDRSVERILDVCMRYYDKRPEGTAYDYEAHHEAAREIAAQSMVLLKNDGVLPLEKRQKVVFIGEFADKPRFQGGGSSHVNSFKVDSSVEAAKGLPVTYVKGFPNDKDERDEALLREAVEAAKNAEAAVIFAGLPEVMESEGFDRKNMDIPACQTEVIEAVSKVQKNVIVVVQCGSAIVMPWRDRVGAILYAYLGGEAVGSAILDLIYGDKNPSGKLAETFPLCVEDNPSYLYYGGEGDRVEYREGVFVGYRYYDKKKMDVAYPFGFGLSYTTFEYSDLVLDKAEMTDADTLRVSLKVKNTGSTAGKEAVQLYVGAPVSEQVIRPEKELRGFEKVALGPGEEKTVEFTLDKRAFAYYNTQIDDWYVPTDTYTVMVGASSRDIRICEQVQVTSTTVIKQIYTINSTIGDMMKNPVGKQIFEQMIAKMAGDDLDLTALGPSADALMTAMLNYLPLRAVNIFGEVGSEQLQAIVDQINASNQ